MKGAGQSQDAGPCSWRVLSEGGEEEKNTSRRGGAGASPCRVQLAGARCLGLMLTAWASSEDFLNGGSHLPSPCPMTLTQHVWRDESREA